MATKKRPHECAFCGATFVKSLDHMIHATDHIRDRPAGVVPRHERTRRKVSCWGCAKEMEPPAPGEPYRCECGFVLPPKAQFVESKNENDEQQTTE